MESHWQTHFANKIKYAWRFSGEGGTSEGDFHEALNVAAVWDLPVIFLIENNGYGLSTPVSEQYRCEKLTDKAIGYGMDAIQIDGNNVLTVYDTVRGVRDYCIENKKPPDRIYYVSYAGMKKQAVLNIFLRNYLKSGAPKIL